MSVYEMQGFETIIENYLKAWINPSKTSYVYSVSDFFDCFSHIYLDSY